MAADSDDSAKYMAGAFMAFGIPALFGCLVLADGWALSVLWAWFAVPTFSLPVLSVPQAIGVQLVWGKLRGIQISEKTRGSALWSACLAPFVAIGIGWVVKMFI